MNHMYSTEWFETLAATVPTPILSLGSGTDKGIMV